VNAYKDLASRRVLKRSSTSTARIRPIRNEILNRFSRPLGLLWFGDKQLVSDETAHRLLEAFCIGYGLQERDLGVGLFFSRYTPLGRNNVKVMHLRFGSGQPSPYSKACRKLFDSCREGSVLARSRGDEIAVSELGILVDATRDFETCRQEPSGLASVSSSSRIEVVASGELATFVSFNGSTEVRVKGHRYTPSGLMYELEPDPGTARWAVPATQVLPIPGISKIVILNLDTGEIE